MLGQLELAKAEEARRADIMARLAVAKAAKAAGEAGGGGGGGGGGAGGATPASPKKGAGKDGAVSKKKSKQLMDRLEAFDGGQAAESHHLIDAPPAFQPIACKPLLFDIAHNHLDFPDFAALTGERKKAGGQPGSKTWLGWMTGKK
jgi:hypothetical protein